MAITAYRVLAEDASCEIEAKRSRFLAVVRRVNDEADARALVAELRSVHHDARHHCSAFVIGADQRLQRSSDDGEPSGTAGAPMLDTLRGYGDGLPLSDAVAVVVRWFGGTLLGAGGLVRAYSDAVTAALDEATFLRRESRTIASTELMHADAGRIESELRASGAEVLGTDYGSRAVVTFATTNVAALEAKLASATAGAASLTVTGHRWVDLPEIMPRTSSS